MSFLSSQGQINTITSQEAVAAGGAATGVADILYDTDTLIYSAGLYLVSFTTTVGGAITSGFLELQSGGVDFGQIQLFGPGTYTLTAPVYLNGVNSDIVLTVSGTGATYTTSASKIFVIRLP
jgi:hypothetical protein